MDTYSSSRTKYFTARSPTLLSRFKILNDLVIKIQDPALLTTVYTDTRKHSNVIPKKRWQEHDREEPTGIPPDSGSNKRGIKVLPEEMGTGKARPVGDRGKGTEAQNTERPDERSAASKRCRRRRMAARWSGAERRDGSRKASKWHLHRPILLL